MYFLNPTHRHHYHTLVVIISLLASAELKQRLFGVHIETGAYQTASSIRNCGRAVSLFANFRILVLKECIV